MDSATRRTKAISQHITEQTSPVIEHQQCSSKRPTAEKQTLAMERRKASFEVKELANILAGSAEKFQLYQDCLKLLDQEPLFTKSQADFTHSELREMSMAKIKRVLELQFDRLPHATASMLGKVMYMHDAASSVRLGVHTGLFCGSLSGNGTDYHKKKYLKPAMQGRLFGCFGMTEMGHGSNAAGLETTATFDKKNQQFIIHSPTLTSTKWWIGGVGETATHSCVFARLIVGEKDFGVHSFVVQIRDLKTHKPMPGVTIGDCGVKLGLNGTDNGFLRFDKVRIAREDMLDQYARVNEDGSYWKAGKASLALQRVALIGARCNIVSQSAIDGAMGLTIAIRYSAIRTQFADEVGKPAEKPILDYQTQQYRLLLPLADVIATTFTGLRLADAFDRLTNDLSKGNTVGLNDVHAIAAGMKAVSSWSTRDALILCRDCLGGHGISAYNRLAGMIRDFQVQTTWDGDNTVLSQQTARYLVNAIQKVMEGKKLKGSIQYLEHTSTILSSKWPVKDENDILSIEHCIEAFQWRTTNLCANSATKIQQEVANGKDPIAAWNSCLVELILLSRAHCEYYKLQTFADVIEKNKTANPEIVTLLTNLCLLYALSNIEKDLGTFRDNDFISSEQARLIKKTVRDLCSKIRPYAVTVVDAFVVPDWVLDSQFGRYDGNIYEKYFKRVQQGHQAVVPEYWERLIKPLTNRTD